MDTANLEAHAAAELFPLLRDSEYESLKNDIAEHGQLEPIVLYEGKILDGRNRYQACLDLGLTPLFREYTGDDPISYVVSLNLHRRHLDASQRAMVSYRIADMRSGERTDLDQIWSRSLADSAETMNVSRGSTISAGKVQREGTPELIQAVDRGDVAVSAAAEVASLPPDRQIEILHQGPREVSRAARDVKAERRAQRERERIETRLRKIEVSEPLTGTAQKFGVIYFDPTWMLKAEDAGAPSDKRHRPLTFDEIEALPVHAIAEDDAVLFVWSRMEDFPRTLYLLDGWGFQYRANIVWDQNRANIGDLVAPIHEHLIIGMRGDVDAPPHGARPQSIIRARAHSPSSKPPEFYSMVETMYPEAPRVELYADSWRDGWERWVHHLGTASTEAA